jgi:predicted DCC family thiol-disulfide oxidoreductase YuxK
MEPKDRPVVLYDGACGLCGATVAAIRRRDRHGRFRFVTQASPEGVALRAAHRVPATLDSVVVIDAGRAFVKSAALLRVLRRLGGGWHLLRVGAAIPRPVRDGIYDLVARNRRHICQNPGAGPHVYS